MEEEFYQPVKMMEKLNISHYESNTKSFYQYLVSFGMYKPSKRSKEQYEELIKNKVWEKVSKLAVKYKKRWHGPDIPIYIFPLHSTFSGGENKSGVSFPDMLFLFVGDVKDDRELEALFIHEYHHVCRIYHQKKEVEEYTLLDSMVMEGLAEHAVTEICGADYNAAWCNLYKEEEIERFLEKIISGHLNLKKDEYLHDLLLFGVGKFPDMLGYCCGYYLVGKYKNQYRFTESQYFLLKSEVFM